MASIGGEVQAVELYGSPSLFGSVSAHSLRSLALEALGSSATGTPPDDAAAAAALNDWLSGSVASRNKSGSADVLETKSPGKRSYVVFSEDGELLQALGYVD